MHTECRAVTPGFPCNTTATHPAAPLGSRRRSAPPLSFATRNLQKWQELNEDELRDEEFAKNFHVAFRRGALKAAFKQKLVPRVTRVAHVPRRRKIQARSPAQSSPGGAARTLPLPMRNKRTLFSDALLPALYLKRAQPEIYGIMQDCFRWIVPFYRVRPINHRNFIGAI